ncbi:hypothetical protein HDV02_006243 [Globomyces sp. JEL0801]|nr:hypothetical protein HDV02_006243 [Globomyces sp. JEL0801]
MAPCSLGYTKDWGIMIDNVQSIYLRMKQLNENSDLLGDDVALEPIFMNHNFARDMAITNAIDFKDQGVVAVIGSGGSSLSILTSLVLQNYRIPQCCGSSTNPTLSDKKQYPNFFRTIPTDASMAEAMIGYVLASGWKKIAIVHVNDDYGTGFANYLMNVARTRSVEVLAKVNVKPVPTVDDVTPALQTVQESGARIIFYFGYVDSYMAVLPIARSLGIFGKDYVWFGGDPFTDLPVAYPDKGSLYEGTLGFYPREAQGPAAPVFADYWAANRLQSTFINKTSTALTLSTPYAYYFSTCVDLFVHGFDALLKSNSTFTIDDLISGQLNKNIKVPESFVFPDLQTPTGKVKSDQNGDRIGDFDIFNFLADGTSKIVGGWNDGQRVLNPDVPIVYPGGSLVQPKDGIDPNDVAVYATPSSGLATLSVLFAIFGAVLTLISILGVLKYRKVGAVKKSGVMIGYGMQLCLLLMNIQFLVMIDKPTASKCAVDAFLIPVLFSFYYGLLFAKNLRIYRIFYKPPSRFQLSDAFIYMNGLLIALPSLLVSIIWVAADPPLPSIVKVSMTQYYWTCKSARGLEATAISIHIVINALVLLGNLVMAFMTRNVVSTYSETKMISSSVYNMTVISLFTIIVLSSESLGYQAKYIIKSIATIYVLLFNVSSNFLYKIYVSMTDSNSLNSNSRSGTSENKSEAGNLKPAVNEGGQVSLTTANRFGVNSTRIVLLKQISADAVEILDVRRVSLESKETQTNGVGIVWDVNFLKQFSKLKTEPLVKSFKVDDRVYQFEFTAEKDADLWTTYFSSWTYRVKGAANNQSIQQSSQV